MFLQAWAVELFSVTVTDLYTSALESKSQRQSGSCWRPDMLYKSNHHTRLPIRAGSKDGREVSGAKNPK